MRSLSELGVSVYEVAASFRVRRYMRALSDRMAEHATLSDEEIAQACRKLALSPATAVELESERRQNVLGLELSDADCDALALAAEAFSRFPPAGVPRGTRLYDEQLLAAIHLLRGALVQMDTGEGKTFALSTAALALLRKHSNVCIVTANHYLAARDALTTRPFWEALGLSVGLTAEHNRDNSSHWEANVVYTTLEALVFDSLDEDLNGTERLRWDAVLIDEADAILLEQCTERYLRSRPVDDRGKDWSAALRIAAALDEGDVQVEAGLSTIARLTAAGEAKVVSLGGSHASRPSERLLLMRDVELAYAGTRVARPGHDYDVRAGEIVKIDSASGWQTPLVRPDWLPPLEQHLGLPQKPRTVLRQMIEGIFVLSRFRHLAGASGTIVGEALHYVMLLGMPLAVIPPRTPRREGRRLDVLVESREDAHRWVAAEAVAQGPRRPILIAADSTEEAQQLGALIESAAAIDAPGLDIRVVTDETIASQRVFEDAGRPGSVVVSTRVSGRGVDIRLSPEARANGGAMLFALGHSPEARLDRQLLGRVGREGERYTAQFVNYPEDGLVRRVAQTRIEAIFSRLPSTGALETRAFRHVLTQAQRMLGRQRLYSFIATIAQGGPRGDAYELLRGWRQALGPYGDGGLSDAFLSFVADRYVAAEFPALSFVRRPTLAMLETATAQICELTGDSQEVADGLVVEATGMPAAQARSVLSDHLQKALGAAAATNAEARRELRRRTVRAERAALDARLRAFSRALGEVEAKPGDGGGLPATVAAALAASGDTAEVAVSVDLIDAARDEMCERLREGEPAGSSAGSGDGSYDSAWRRQARRSSWLIASETIDLATRQIYSGHGRISFQVSQTETSRVIATYRAKVEELTRVVEKGLAEDICANLLIGADPARVAGLFRGLEHAVPVSTAKVAGEIPTLPPPNPDGGLPEKASVSGRSGELIAEYVGALERRPVRRLDRETLVRALKATLAGSDLAALGEPDRVAAAYAGWKGSEIRRDEVPPWRWRDLDAQVRGFLRFLYERGLAAPLPTGLRARSRSRARRMLRTAASPGWALALGGLGISVALAALLALASPVGPGLDGDAAPRLLDSLLSGGTIGAGSALGPVLLALVGAMWGRMLMGLPTSSQAGVTEAERGVALLLLAGGGLLVLHPWAGGSIWGALGLLVGWIGLTAVGFLIRNGVYRFEHLTHHQLVTLLGAAFAAFAAVPLLVDEGGASRVVPIVAAAAVIPVVALPLRRARLSALALHVDPDDEDHRESLRVELMARGRISVLPHAFALASAWALSCVALQAGSLARALVAGVTYSLVLAVWGRSLARSATDLEDWQRRMRRDEQAYWQDGAGGATLEEALTGARRRIFVTELAVALPLVALATALTLSAPAQLLAQIPLGVAAICVSVIAVDLGLAFVRSLGAPFFSAALAAETAGEEPAAVSEKARAVVRHYVRRMSIAVAILFVLLRIADAVSLGELAVRLWEWLSGVVG